VQSPLGLLLVALGVVLVILGLLVWTGALGWFGQLPGDLRWEGDRTRVFFPVTSMILLSVVLTLVLWVVRRLL
jgi:ribose/xylose/arabinose/galactoside ABC-type transport system permease subunit